jgi:hypothetical protein
MLIGGWPRSATARLSASAVKRPICIHGNAFAGELIDQCQDAIRASIVQLVVDEIGVAPTLHWCRLYRTALRIARNREDAKDAS